MKTIKKVTNTEETKLSRSQRDAVAKAVIKQFRNCPLYPKFGPTIQSLGIEVINFIYKHSKFSYEIWEDEDSKKILSNKRLLTDFTFNIPGIKVSLDVKVEIKYSSMGI